MPSTNAGYSDGNSLAQYGPTLWVRVGAGTEGSPESPQVQAFIDTGADLSCVDVDLARSLSLQLADIRTTRGIHGEQRTEFYLAQLRIPVLSFTGRGILAGLHLQSSGFRQSVLLGRDFLRYFSMLYDGRTGATIVGDEQAP